MSVDAVAVIRVPYVDVCKIHGLTPAATHVAALEETFPFVPVGEEATGCFLLVPFLSDPEDIAAATRQAVGTILDRHDDERGIPVLSDAGWPDAGYASYEEVAQVSPKLVPKISEADLRRAVEEQMRAAGFGELAPKIEAGMREAMTRAQGADAGGFQAGLFEAAAQMLAAMSPEEQAQLEVMAKQMFGLGDPTDGAGPGGPARPPEPAQIIDDEFGDPEDVPPKK